MKKKLLIVFCLSLCLVLTACSNDKAVDSGETNKETANQEEVSKSKTLALGLTKCGEVYKDKELSYNVIGVRTNAYENGVTYLILKLEVLNHSNDNINFSAFDRFALFGGDTEYALDIMADVDTDLTGTITPDNKIMGEVAFEITDSTSDEYVLHIGRNFEYTPAIKIGAGDIGKSFVEQLEGSGVTSEYTIGVPVESKQLTILLQSVTIKESDKEGKEILLLDLAVTNNESESNNFMLGINFNGVFTAQGVQLDEAVNDWTLQSDISANETINGIASFYIEEGARGFYMTLTPDLDDFSNKKMIVFTAE